MASKGVSIIHIVTLSTLLALFWLLNSGHYTPLMLLLGGLSIAVVVFITARMQVIDGEAQPLHLTWKIPGYYLWLLGQIIRSNLQIACQIWRLSPDISPTLLTVHASQQSDLGRVIYANSVTLVPGTVTINLRGSTLTVHALTQEAARELNDGEMDYRISRMDP